MANVQRRSLVWVVIASVCMLAAPASAHHNEVVDKLERGRTSLISLSSVGDRGDASSGNGCDDFPYSASDDGRFIAFASRAGNLHQSDVNGEVLYDVFLYDRKTANMELVSALPSGLAPPVPNLPDVQTDLTKCIVRSSAPAISGNGRFVAFISNLPLTGEVLASDVIPLFKVYVWDRVKNTTELVSETSDGEPPNDSSGVDLGGQSSGLSISDDGRFVAFTSMASNLVDGACDSEAGPAPDLGAPLPCSQTYVRDVHKDKTVLVSRSTAGKPANYGSRYPSLSGNGRVVAFETEADNLIENDINDCPHRVPTSVEPPPSCSDVFVHDLGSGVTQLVSVSREGRTASDQSVVGSWGGGHQTISDDGRFVTFYSYGVDIVPANHHLYPATLSGTYVRDLQTGRTERLSVSSTGAMLTSNVIHTVSDDGRYALFNAHLMTDVYMGGAEAPLGGPYTPRDQGHEDRGTFRLDRATGQLDWVLFNIRDGSYDGAPPGTDMVYGALGGNGRFVVGASNQIDGPSSQRDTYDVYVRDLGNTPMGVGPFGGSAGKHADLPDGKQICIAPQTCVPPNGAVSRHADTGRRGMPPGTRLYGASIAYRPELRDLYVAIELEHMGPSLSIGPTGLMTGGPMLVYGFRFEVRDRSYEVRATSLLGGTFGLFDCTDGCTEAASLKGGYGTTGERVVVSLPLAEVGLRAGDTLRNAEVFSAVGSYASGALQVYDRLRIR